MRIYNFKNKKLLLLTLLLIALTLLVSILFIYNFKSSKLEVNTSDTSIESDNAAQEQSTPEEAVIEEVEKPVDKPATATPAPAPEASKWPVQLSNAEAGSITVIVNKKHKLPSSYTPNLSSVAGGQLRPEATSAFNDLLAAAKNSGLSNMKYVSGYRSYGTQQSLYNNYVARDGQAAADTYSARPGHSEHQTGLAVDVGNGGGCDLEICFADTAEGKWVASNAYKYGFVVRYPKGKESTTGYQYEPWHLRYLGVAEATAVFNSGKTLEEYYNIPGGGY